MYAYQCRSECLTRLTTCACWNQDSAQPECMVIIGPRRGAHLLELLEPHVCCTGSLWKEEHRRSLFEQLLTRPQTVYLTFLVYSIQPHMPCNTAIRLMSRSYEPAMNMLSG